MLVVCCVGSGLCDGLMTRSGESYWLCVCVCMCVCMYVCMYACMSACVGPCHHGMARPQVADGGTASVMEGSCEEIE